MPGQYTIRLDPNIKPIQDAHCKAPIESREKIEANLLYHLTYPRKSDGSLCVYMDPRDLDYAILSQYYKASTLDKIANCLSRAMVFSKLDAMNSFWSIHLDEANFLLMSFNTQKGKYRLLHMPLV